MTKAVKVTILVCILMGLFATHFQVWDIVSRAFGQTEKNINIDDPSEIPYLIAAFTAPHNRNISDQDSRRQPPDPGEAVVFAIWSDAKVLMRNPNGVQPDLFTSTPDTSERFLEDVGLIAQEGCHKSNWGILPLGARDAYILYLRNECDQLIMHAWGSNSATYSPHELQQIVDRLKSTSSKIQQRIDQGALIREDPGEAEARVELLNQQIRDEMARDRE